MAQRIFWFFEESKHFLEEKRYGRPSLTPQMLKKNTLLFLCWKWRNGRLAHKGGTSRRLHSLSSKCAPLKSDFSQTWFFEEMKEFSGTTRYLMGTCLPWLQMPKKRKRKRNVWHQRSKRCSICTNQYFLRRTVEIAHVFVILGTRFSTPQMRSFIEIFNSNASIDFGVYHTKQAHSWSRFLSKFNSKHLKSKKRDCMTNIKFFATKKKFRTPTVQTII